MSREAASRCQLRDAIVPNIYQGGQRGSPAFGRSDLSISVADNWPARIFIVEDDPVMLRMVGDYVEQHNMRAVPASGRLEMVDHFAAAEPDLVVLDLRLGQEDGSTCCARSGRGPTFQSSSPPVIGAMRSIG
jgi:PleD family two-component response regulator